MRQLGWVVKSALAASSIRNFMDRSRDVLDRPLTIGCVMTPIVPLVGRPRTPVRARRQRHLRLATGPIAEVTALDQPQRPDATSDRRLASGCEHLTLPHCTVSWSE